MIHYILTRFNIGLYSDPESAARVGLTIKDPDAWMRHRLDLFENFTLASMRNQTCQKFSWVLLMDRQTPKEFIQKIEKFNYSNIKICYNDVSLYSPQAITAKMCGIENEPNILQTRIDNDDIFHKDFVKRIQQKSNTLLDKIKPYVISFPLGYDLNLETKQVVLHRYRTNNCMTLVLPGDQQNFVSVFCQEPSRLLNAHEHFQLMESEPYWIIIIHDRNLGNKKFQVHFRSAQSKEVTKSILTTFGIGGRFN